MRLPRTLLLVVFVAAIAISILYGRREETQNSLGIEGFMDAGTGAAIGVGILGVIVIGAFFYGIKPEKVF